MIKKSTAFGVLLVCGASVGSGENLRAISAPAVPPSRPAAQRPAKPLYQNNFQNVAPGKAPQEFLILGGQFNVVKDGANTVLELPGEPLDTFGLLFGPTISSDAGVRARINGTSKGRRYPTFGVGLYGVSGYKLRVAPAKDALELVKDEEVKASTTYKWKPGAWTFLRLQAHKLKNGQWRVEGKAWQGAVEPKTWMVSTQTKEAPAAGRCSLWATPYASTPVRFDDLLVSQAQP